jgi:hypothetical protein
MLTHFVNSTLSVCLPHVVSTSAGNSNCEMKMMRCRRCEMRWLVLMMVASWRLASSLAASNPQLGNTNTRGSEDRVLVRISVADHGVRSHINRAREVDRDYIAKRTHRRGR